MVKISKTFTRVPNCLYDDERLSCFAIHLFAHILGFIQTGEGKTIRYGFERYFFGGDAYLAGYFHVSVSTIEKTISLLKRTEYIEVDHHYLGTIKQRRIFVSKRSPFYKQWYSEIGPAEVSGNTPDPPLIKNNQHDDGPFAHLFQKESSGTEWDHANVTDE